MKWTKQANDREYWAAYPSHDHALEVYPHAGGFGWGTFDLTSERTEKIEDAPQGWDSTLDDAKPHAEAAYFEWVEEMRDAKVLEERAAVVAFVRGARLDDLADAIERGEHCRGGGA